MDYFCLRKQVEAGEAHKFSTADLIAHAEAKVKFSSTGIDNLYQKWRFGQTSFDQVRKSTRPFGGLRR